MGGFVAELFLDFVLDGLVWGTGAAALKLLRPGRPVDHTSAIILGLFIWLAVIAALLTIGYLLLA